MNRQSLWERCVEVGREHPGSPLFTFLSARAAPKVVSYEDVLDRARLIGERLRTTGIPPGGTVGVLLSGQEDQIIHHLAALSVDLVPTILAPKTDRVRRDYYLETLRSFLRTAPFSAIISDVVGADAACPTLAPETLVVLEPGGGSPSPRPVSPRAFLQYTSGTTGTRKGVLLSHAAVLANLDAFSAAAAITRADRVASWLPLYHDMGLVGCVMLALSQGVHTVLMQPEDYVKSPGAYLEAISLYRCTLGFNPNFAYSFMAARATFADESRLDLSSLRGLLNASEPVTTESQRRFESRFSPRGLRAGVFWGAYGAAETTFALTHIAAGDPAYVDERGPEGYRGSRPFVSVGRPIDGVDIEVRDDEGRAVGDRHEGELWVRAPYVLDEYYDRPEATALALRDGWYRTGDVGYFVGGALYLSGRKRDMLIIGGVNVYAHDVEETVCSVEGVRPGRVSVSGEFYDALQTERMMILLEARVPLEKEAAVVLAVRERVMAEHQVTAFDVHVVPEGFLQKSSSGKMARALNHTKWKSS